jgi:hypothetical protein
MIAHLYLIRQFQGGFIMKKLKFITFLSLFSFATVSLPVASQKQSVIQRVCKHRYFKRAAVVSFGITIIFLSWYNRDKLPFFSPDRDNQLDRLINNANASVMRNLTAGYQECKTLPLNADELELLQIAQKTLAQASSNPQ